ncbi:hypothetical protein [Thiomicrospira sp.]|uniref:hypothetical protein n=1 Tax=Thiomicrospira sp. TaxID=935 RepID=UPI002F91DE27
MSENIQLHSEIKFRSARNQIKQIKYLSIYTDDLLENGHILEAKYFVDQLVELKPSHPKALTLAYKIAVNMNDHTRVKECDEKLIRLKKVPIENVISLQIEFYVKNNLESTLYKLCKEYLYRARKLEDTTYAKLVSFAQERKNFFILFNTLNHLRKSNLQGRFVFNNEQAMKKILIIGLLKFLRDIYE